MRPKISDISSKKLTVIWKTLNLLSLFTFLLFPGIIKHLPALHKPSIIVCNYVIGFSLFIISNLFHYYAYQKDKSLSPRNTAVRVEMPVTDTRMKAVWILLNLTGLALMLSAAIMVSFLNILAISIIFCSGVVIMSVSAIFKRNAYRRNEYDNSGTAS